MNFTGFYGNEAVKERLNIMFSEDRVPHALILEGAAGIGKKTLAMLISQAVVCKSEGERPCGVCGGCVRAKNHSHPDITIVEGSGKTGAISVDSIREVKDDAYIMPSEAEKKVYILPDADKTLPAAQNAFLKVLEEPPADTMFIITCTAASSLLETIRSRAVIIRMQELSEQEAVAAVSAMTGASPSDILTAYAVCGGNAGMIAARLSDSSMSECMVIAAEMTKAILSPREIDLILASAPVEKDRDMLTTVMTVISMTVRDALMIKNGRTGGMSGNREGAEQLSVKLTSARLLNLYSACERIIEGSKRSVNMGLLLSEMCLSLRNAAGMN